MASAPKNPNSAAMTFGTSRSKKVVNSRASADLGHVETCENAKPDITPL
jgi:hypothetical protein